MSGCVAYAKVTVDIVKTQMKLRYANEKAFATD